MCDPGLPPKPRSLNLLESLVKEEEERELYLHSNRGAPNVVADASASHSPDGLPEFFDSETQQIKRENSLSASFGEYKMKDMDSESKVKRGNPHAGFKGKKLKKQRSRSNSRDRDPKKQVGKKLTRPFSADSNKFKRNGNSAADRPSTARGRQLNNNRTSSPRRPRRSYSSDSYSSDSGHSPKRKEHKVKESHDAFYDSDRVTNDDVDSRSGKADSNKTQSNKYSSDSDSHRSEPRAGKRGNVKVYFSAKGKGKKQRHRSRSSSSSSSRSRSSKSRSSSSSSSSSDDKNRRQVNGHSSRGKTVKRNTKTVYIHGDGQRTGSKKEDPNCKRSVVVEDYSSLSSSEDDSKKNAPSTSSGQILTLRKKKSKRLLSRKKDKNYGVFQINPDQYIQGKLHQKYTELEELLACSFVDQKSHVTRHHLYQMELLRDQYQAASHGHMSSATIIPRSLPSDVRNRSARPSSGRRAQRQESDSESGTFDHAYGTLRSVMAAEHARQTNKIRTDIHAEYTHKNADKKKKKKKVVKGKGSDTDEPSFASSKGNSSNSTATPRGAVKPGIDHHIKYSENDKLKIWLKEKDRLHRRQARDERKKKREEREKLIDEANDKIEKRLLSQKQVKRWMKEKEREFAQKCKEERTKEKQALENQKLAAEQSELPGQSMKIRPQSAPPRRSEDVKIDDKDLKGGKTPANVKQNIRLKQEIEEENRQAKIAQSGGPHPPSSKFIYKRPVAGKIKLNMQVRGKSPVSQKAEPEKKKEADGDQMRMSYDDWIKKKQISDAEKKKKAQRQKELAKSDPELERIVPGIAKKRIEEKLNSRKRIDTGIKKFDNKVNKSYGGSEFSGEAIERPRSAYRLESSRKDDDQPALSVSSKQLQRPSTAPASRGRSPPSPTKSVRSPRKAVIPEKVDKIMSNNDTSNPYTLPFTPDKGIPAHVVRRQKKVFAEIVTSNLDEIEQRALMNAELIKEGVSDEDIERYREKMEEDIANYKAQMKGERPYASTDRNENNGTNDNDTSNRDETNNVPDAHPKITEIMYSPRKSTDTDTSSEEETSKETTDSPGEMEKQPEKETFTDNTTENVDTLILDRNEKDKVAEQEQAKVESESRDGINAEHEDVAKDRESRNTAELDLATEAQPEPVSNEDTDASQNQYRTYENLNELNIDPSDFDWGDMGERSDEELRIAYEKLEALRLSNEEELRQRQQEKDQKRHEILTEESSKIKLVVECDPNLVSILKERRDGEAIPDPVVSEGEPKLAEKQASDEEHPASPRDHDANMRKRVSFNEQTEVFQSFESSSTDTVTPAPDEGGVNAEREGLDAHNDEEYDQDFEYDDDYEEGQPPDNDHVFITAPESEQPDNVSAEVEETKPNFDPEWDNFP